MLANVSRNRDSLTIEDMRDQNAAFFLLHEASPTLAQSVIDLTEENGRLREALEPFARLAAVFDAPGGTTPTAGEIYTWSRMVNGEPTDFTLTVEMLKAARDLSTTTG
jgi:hypothetical protein